MFIKKRKNDFNKYKDLPFRGVGVGVGVSKTRFTNYQSVEFCVSLGFSVFVV